MDLQKKRKKRRHDKLSKSQIVWKKKKLCQLLNLISSSFFCSFWAIYVPTRVLQLFLKSRTSGTMSKYSKLQLTNCFNMSVIGHWSSWLQDLVSSSFLVLFFYHSSWLWVHQVVVYNMFLNSKSNERISKDFKFFDTLSVRSPTCLAWYPSMEQWKGYSHWL
jgi:hypothetical protein